MLSPDLSKFDDAKRGLAKLMAKENISVQIISGAPTASFDMVARVLTLPDWPGLTVDQIDLLIGHEVGHSLHTSTSYIEDVMKSRKLKKHPGLMSYINVVEDARIERKQREAYPGLTASFYEGYRTFSEKGPIFKVKGTKVDGKSVNKMSLIDRINVFYKLGAFVKVSFALDEQKWIGLIDKAWSTERAVEIAQELHELAKDEIEKQQQEQKDKQNKNQPKQKGPKQESNEPGEPSESGDESEESEGDDDKQSTNDGDDSGVAEGDNSDEEDAEESEGDDESADATDGESDGESATDDKDADAKDSKTKPNRADLDPTSETDKALADTLKKLAESQPEQPLSQQIRHLLLKPLDEATVRARTITAEVWADGAAAVITRNAMGSSILKLEEQWNAKYLSTAVNMAQEFMRRKTAKNLQHARVAKSGRLDMTKLAKYKFAEDLFKNVTTIPNGQSHGIVMIIDGSGSMKNVFGKVLDQVLLFAHFAHKTHIPFECYMFSNANDHYYSTESMGLQTITLPPTGSLIGLVNTVANPSAFKKQIHAVLAYRRQITNDGYGQYGVSVTLPYSKLGMTPLYAGMMIAERHVERMKRTLHLDKVMTVVISDGEDNGGLEYETQDIDNNGRVKRSFVPIASTAVVVRDTITKKNHVLVTVHPGSYGQKHDSYAMPPTGVMTLFFDVLKERHGCRNIYLYLVDSVHEAFNACNFLVRADVKLSVQVAAVHKAMSTAKQFVMPADQSAADCALVVEPMALHLTDDAFAGWNPKGATQTQVAQEFVFATSKAIANRVFVNSVMPHLA